ncbi:MAG TPA: hypothetical protein VK358_15360, partial [Longimicrobium sp.]|nr:hypothetical protein [Longimicrobium sp.]
AYGQSGGEWLLVSGRRSGLHAIDTTLVNAFPTSGANDRAWVVNPATSEVWSVPLTSLPDSLADPLKATNANAYQDGDWLYLIGGYGHDSRTDSMVTFPTLTAIDVPRMIAAVKAGGSLAGTVWRRSHFAWKVAGGQLMKMNNRFYLVMGQRFDGLYSANPGYWDQFVQIYTERIQVGQITPPPSLNFAVETVISQNPNEWARNFHRRDLNVVGAYDPAGNKRLAVYGGVFVPGQDAAYRVPVYVSGTTARVDSSFFQAMSQYDAASLLLYDRTRRGMYTTLFGGISLYFYDNERKQLHVDTGLPFIDDVSVIAVTASGTRQWAYPWTLPALLGADARVILKDGLQMDPELEVVYLDALPAGRATQVGWLYGGIHSQQPQTEDQQAQTSASSRVFQVWVTPAPTDALPLPTGTSGSGR